MRTPEEIFSLIRPYEEKLAKAIEEFNDLVIELTQEEYESLPSSDRRQTQTGPVIDVTMGSIKVKII